MPDLKNAPPAYGPDNAHYTDPGFRAEFVADMERVSPFQQRFPAGITKLRYDPRKFDFCGIVGDTLAAAGVIDRGALSARADRLEFLHELVAPDDQVMDGSQQSAAARVLYEMPAAFASLYERLLDEVVVPAIGLGPAHFQKVPTFRVFFPNAPGYPGATSYHTDIQIGHNPREVNVFFPLVPCAETRSLLMAPLHESLQVWREYDYDFVRFGRDTQHDPAMQARCGRICQPLRVGVGEIVVFDSRCMHAGPHNKTALTRVTFDARVLPVGDHALQQNVYQGRGRRRASFAIGEYFSANAVGQRTLRR
ncbi:MAG: phytanoyl-CoA dioxygenase family protein [Planctomycetes bacterium]|nr:phytanoyl-CoA dioxygenase family protein [Planctomycetota bacterium]